MKSLGIYYLKCKNSHLVIANPFFAGEAIPARRTCLQQAEAGLTHVCFNVNEILNKKCQGLPRFARNDSFILNFLTPTVLFLTS
jgi:hypothetical protein